MLAAHPRASSLALALAASASLVYAHAHSRRSHTPAPDSPTTPTPTTPEPPTQDKKRFLTKREFFDPQTSRFIDEHSDSDSDSDDGDDDEDGKSADDKDTQKKKKTKKPKYLFTASSRTYPRSPDFAGYQDYVALSLHASPLIAALRAVPALASTESVFDDKPDLDARDLFLVRDDVRAFVRELTDEARRVRASEDDEGGAHDEDGTDVAATQATTDAHPLVVQPEKKSAEALELEAEQVGVLLDYLDDLFKATQAKLQRLLHPPPPPAPPASSTSSSTAHPTSAATTETHAHAQISWPLLWALFKPESLAVAEHETSGEKYAFRVKSSNYQMSRDGMVFILSGQTIMWNGDKYVRSWVEERVPKFKGLRRLSSLSLAPLDPSSTLHADLSSRGLRYTTLTGDAHLSRGGNGTRFLDYHDSLLQVLGSGMDRRVVKTRAEGRAVVDVKGYRRMNPSRAMQEWWEDEDDDDPFLYGIDLRPSPTSDSDALSPTSVSPSDLVLLPPTVYAFSLVAREWGECLVARFSDIRFRTDAWDRLVLAQDTKDLLRGLVECNEAVRRAKNRGKKGEGDEEAVDGKKEVISDIVEGKGGGLVVCMHGPPGVGKTLTAEAVAESLQVPLYTVGAGQLGVQADILEKRLRDVLDIAETWGATLLIDEADVFLAARTLGDLQRNAMVSVFLRLLEHHQGVLLLTTNNVRHIDEAFLSRFSLAITYPNLDRQKRKTIWRSFLELAGVGISDSPAPKPLPNGHSTAAPPPPGTPKSFDSYISPAYLSTLASKSDLNGRQIKNAVRTAQALALSQRVPLAEEHLAVVVSANEQFKRDFEEADEKGVYEAPGEG
ncbi:hypothetical protein Rhopal_001205-T1 [Rhodotorula paludigena]|uniref:AAA+ ATPase domain-containing protein n=1 Tax=Rhodotorula paludigena TaxID=86838 RepID=A0AAV5GES0_9BASI|nr:hypothetical protein Rhopal_001205-T1 [Rhodotorula paludigena]